VSSRDRSTTAVECRFIEHVAAPTGCSVGFSSIEDTNVLLTAGEGGSPLFQGDPCGRPYRLSYRLAIHDRVAQSSMVGAGLAPALAAVRDPSLAEELEYAG